MAANVQEVVLWQGEVFGWSAGDYDPESWLDQLRAIAQFFKLILCWFWLFSWIVGL